MYMNSGTFQRGGGMNKMGGAKPQPNAPSWSGQDNDDSTAQQAGPQPSSPTENAANPPSASTMPMPKAPGPIPMQGAPSGWTPPTGSGAGAPPPPAPMGGAPGGSPNLMAALMARAPQPGAPAPALGQPSQQLAGAMGASQMGGGAQPGPMGAFGGNSGFLQQLLSKMKTPQPGQGVNPSQPSSSPSQPMSA